MRLLITVFITMSISFAAQAKSATKFDGKLLSYKSLMELSSKKRMQYLKDLGQLLALIEKGESRYDMAKNSSLQEIKEQIAYLMQEIALMPEAKADNAPSGAPVSRTPRWSGNGWTCVGEKLAFDPTLGTCAVQQTTGMRRTPTFWFSPNTCPENTTAVGPKGGSRKCIPQESWDALSRERRRDITKGVRYPTDYFQGESAESTKDVTLGAGTHSPDGASLVLPTGRPGIPEPVVSGPPAPAPAQSVAVEPTPPRAQCVKPTFNCTSMTESAKTDLIAKFRRNKAANVCVAGGFFTPKIPNKKTHVCELKREFKFSSTSTKKCTKPNEAMCNPLVFCVGMKVNDLVKDLLKTDPALKPLEAQINKNAVTIEGSNEKLMQVFVCAKSGQDLTEECNKAVDGHINGQVAVLAKGETYVACDPTKVKGLELQNEWNALRKNVEDQYRAQCANTSADFATLFCRECQIISEKIMAMNDAATGQPCVSGGGATPAREGEPQTVPRES